MAVSYFLIESDGYLYSVPSSDLRTTSASTVEVGDDLKFLYGKNQFVGRVLFIAKKEKDVLRELQNVKKEKKRKKREESFHEERPRKCVVKARQTMDPEEQHDIPAVSKRNTASNSSVLKEKQANKIFAEIIRDKEMEVLADGAQRGTSTSSTELECNDGLISTGSSYSSSICSSTLLAAETEALKRKDVDDLKNILDLENNNVSCDGADDGCSKLCRSDSVNDYLQSAGEASNEANAVKDGKELASTKCEVSQFKTSSDLGETEACIDSDEQQSKKSKKSKGKKNSKSKKYKKSKSKKYKKSKSKKHRKRYPSSSSSSSTSSSASSTSSSASSTISSSSSTSSSSASSSDGEKPQKKTKFRRNMDIYPGPNYLYNENTENVVKLHPNYCVYVKQVDIDRAVESSKTAMNFVRIMVDKIYTREALEGATAQGFPARGRGTKYMRKHKVLPRLHPDGRTALLEKAIDIEKDHKVWRPKAGDKVKEAFRGRVGEF